MNKNEIIDAVLACNDWEGITAMGVFIDRFKALVAVLPSYRDVEGGGVAKEFVAPVEPVLTEEVQPVVEPVVEPAV